MSRVGTTLWYQVASLTNAYWDQVHTPTIKDGGVAIPAANVLEVDWTAGAVRLSTAAAGAVTADHYKFACAQVGGFNSHEITENMEQADTRCYEDFDGDGVLIADETYCATQYAAEGKGSGFWTSVDSVLTESQGSNKDLVYTSRLFGTLGDFISREYQTAGNNTPLSVVVSGNDIIVHNATDAGGVATSTALQIMEKIRASPSASALVRVKLAVGSTGAGIPGTQAHTHLSGGVNPDLKDQIGQDLVAVFYHDKGTALARSTGIITFKKLGRDIKSLKDLVGMTLEFNFQGMVYDHLG
jgi:hypothetical protein